MIDLALGLLPAVDRGAGSVGLDRDGRRVGLALILEEKPGRSRSVAVEDVLNVSADRAVQGEVEVVEVGQSIAPANAAPVAAGPGDAGDRWRRVGQQIS